MIAPGPLSNRPPHILLLIFPRSSKDRWPHDKTSSETEKNAALSGAARRHCRVGAWPVLVLAFVLYGMKAPGGKEGAVNPACPGAAPEGRRGSSRWFMARSPPSPLRREPKASAGAQLRCRRTGPRSASRISKAGRFSSTCGRHGACLAGRKCRRSTGCRALRGSKDFAVVAVNIDTARLDRPKAFLNEIGVKNLTFYADNTPALFQSLKQAGKVIGLPTTILIGKDGCEIGTMAGPAQWDSPDAWRYLTAIQG